MELSATIANHPQLLTIPTKSFILEIWQGLDTRPRASISPPDRKAKYAVALNEDSIFESLKPHEADCFNTPPN